MQSDSKTEDVESQSRKKIKAGAFTVYIFMIFMHIIHEYDMYLSHYGFLLSVETYDIGKLQASFRRLVHQNGEGACRHATCKSSKGMIIHAQLSSFQEN